MERETVDKYGSDVKTERSPYVSTHPSCGTKGSRDPDLNVIKGMGFMGNWKRRDPLETLVEETLRKWLIRT